LVYADDVNLLGDNIDTIKKTNIDTIKKTTETLTDTSKEVGLGVNAEKLSIYCSLITRMQGKIMT
jgi:phosphoglycerate-specific signal transduction histidine kinase